MASGPEHYTKAEKYLYAYEYEGEATALAVASVHATLALAAATAYNRQPMPADGWPDAIRSTT